MAQLVPRKRIQKFKQDVDFLESKAINREAIADRMKIAPENFSACYTESKPITNQFLARFYDAFMDELEPDAEQSLVKGIEEIYRIHDIIVEKLVDGQNRLIDNNVKLVDTNTALTDFTKKLMELLIRHGISTERPPQVGGS